LAADNGDAHGVLGSKNDLMNPTSTNALSNSVGSRSFTTDSTATTALADSAMPELSDGGDAAADDSGAANGVGGLLTLPIRVGDAR
jgi:hypothetical protein